MNNINIPDVIDKDKLFMTDSQLEIIEKINKVIKSFNSNKLNENDENEIEDCIPFIDYKYYSTDEFNKQNFDSKKHFTIMHLNIHSLQLHMGELQIHLH